MIPLQPSYALTIHKSQGMSLDKIMVNLGNREYSLGLTYVALSRGKKISNVALDPFPEFTRFTRMFTKPAFITRKEDNKAAKREEETIAKGYLG